MHNHIKAKARPNLGEAMCTTTAQQRKDEDMGKSEHKHSSEEERPRPGEAYAQPQLRPGKTETRGSLSTTTVH